MYGELKRAWGHGHIKIKRVPWRHRDDHCVQIYGYYTDKYNAMRKYLLGCQPLEQALDKLREKRMLFSDYIFF